MGQPSRATRQRPIVVSDEEEEEEAIVKPDVEEPSGKDGVELTTRQSSGTGKLKPIKKASKKAQEPSPPPSTQTLSPQKPPTKSQKSKVKDTSAAKDQPKRNGKSIASFFNAAVQRRQQQPPAPTSASPERPPPSQEKAEEISSDISDDGGARYSFSKDSSTVFALRKRKGQPGATDHQLHNSSANLPPPPTQKFRKVVDGSRQPSMFVSNDDKRPWVEQFAPQSTEELAVHKRKVGDVKQWLGDAFRGRRRRVLVLKGAAGTGKTATVQLLAKELGVEVLEWKNPAGNEYATEGSLSASAQFEEFVARAGKSAGLTFCKSGEVSANGDLPVPDDMPERDDSRPQLLLVEEFPNTFSRDSPVLLSFRSTLLQYLSAPLVPGDPPTPIVMAISETLLSTSTAAADSFTAHRLLGPELANHPFLNTIEFNPVAPTIMTKALEAIVLKEARKSGRRKTPGPQVLKRIAEAGDIRSAISSLEFLCLRGDEGNIWSSRITFTKPKKAKPEAPLTKAEEEALSLITNRESSLGIFHAVGKIVYNKRLPPPRGTTLPRPPPHLPHLVRSQVPETNIDRLIDDLGTDTSTFVASLHENYALSTFIPNNTEATLASLESCLEALSDADMLSLDRFSFGTRAFSGSAGDSLRQDELAFQTVVRGVLFALPSPVCRLAPEGRGKAEAHRMFYPKSLQLWKGREEVEGVLKILSVKAQSGRFFVAGDGKKGVQGTGGAENWAPKPNKWNEVTGARSAHDDEESDGPVSSTASKTEMLLERLPYMKHLTTARIPVSLREQIAKVTSVEATSAAIDDDDQEGEENLVQTEQWATDRSEVGTVSSNGTVSSKRQLLSDRSFKKAHNEGSRIPVEAGVQSLVLEDDDIEES